MDNIDHLSEARKSLQWSATGATRHIDRSQAHALIAIAERLDLLIEAQKPVRFRINANNANSPS